MDDLKYIKKHYGEKMMHLCRELFPTILDTEGALADIMESCFAPSRTLYYDIKKYMLETSFKNYIYKNYMIEDRKAKYTAKTPEELLKEADYELYECHTEEDIQKFKKYYKEGEELCTFWGGRLHSCYVFFAVKNNAEKLKREDFEKPRREDDYGISVISIQFARDNYTLSIKNRYNHTVNNPDATYGNNLENIIPGLTYSFEKKYGFKIRQNREDSFEIPGYVEVAGKIYKYNYEINNTYYCPNNVIIKNGEIRQYPQEQYIIMDYFIFDIRNRKIGLIDRLITDGLVDEYKNIEKLEIKKEDNKKRLIITMNNQQSIITLNNQNQIIEYENKNIEKIKGGFMCFNETLKKLDIPNVRRIENASFKNCKALEKLDLPLTDTIEFGSFKECESLKELSIPRVLRIENYCFNRTPQLEKLDLPVTRIIGLSCFEDARNITEINAPQVKTIGEHSFRNIQSLKEIDFPNLEEIDGYVFSENDSSEKINVPKLKRIDYNCFHNSGNIKEFNHDTLEIMGASCFCDNSQMEKLNLPNLRTMEENCFRNSNSLKEINLPNLEIMERCCFMRCGEVDKINMPKLKEMGDNCFHGIKSAKELNISDELGVDKEYFSNEKIQNQRNSESLLKFFENWDIEEKGHSK